MAESGLIYPIYRGIIKTELWAKRTRWSTHHENIFRQFGQSLTEEQQTSILVKVSELQESGTSFEEIKGVVYSFL